MEYKYTLIVSQFYYSRHTFIVHHTKDFIERAKSFTAELIAYKRGEEHYVDDPYLGDLDYIKDDKIRYRYNINDHGDIYFIQSNSVNYLKDRAVEFIKCPVREDRGYQKKAIADAISNHHNLSEVRGIVDNHFEIA